MKLVIAAICVTSWNVGKLLLEFTALHTRRQTTYMQLSVLDRTYILCYLSSVEKKQLCKVCVSWFYADDLVNNADM